MPTRWLWSCTGSTRTSSLLLANENAKEARAAGATAASNQIMTLRKPTLAAWLTNLLVLNA